MGRVVTLRQEPIVKRFFRFAGDQPEEREVEDTLSAREWAFIRFVRFFFGFFCTILGGSRARRKWALL